MNYRILFTVIATSIFVVSGIVALSDDSDAAYKQVHAFTQISNYDQVSSEHSTLIVELPPTGSYSQIFKGVFGEFNGEEYPYGGYISFSSTGQKEIQYTFNGVEYKKVFTIVHLGSLEATEPVTYSITYMCVGPATIQTVSVNEGSYTIIQPYTTNIDHTFEGWLCSDGELYQPGDVIQVTSDLQFTGQWKLIEYVVSFDLDGGVNGSASSIDPISVGSGEYADVQLDVSRDGFELKGWSVNGSGLITNPGSYPITKDIVFKAIWAEIFTVTYHPMIIGLDDAVLNRDFTGSIDPILDAVSSANNLAGFDYCSKYNLYFDGWYFISEGFDWVQKVESGFILESDIDLYARWVCDDTGVSLRPSVDNYTYYMYYGISDITTQASVIVGSSGLIAYVVNEPESPYTVIEEQSPGTIEDQGIEFIGWYYSDDGSQPDYSEDPVSFPLVVDGDFFLYAKWVHSENPSVPDDSSGDDGSTGPSVSKDGDEGIPFSAIALAIGCLAVFIVFFSTRRH